MANFITFDGLNFHNLDKINTITFNELRKEINIEDELRVYHSFEIIIDDEVIYTSIEHKVSQGKYDTPNGFRCVRDELNRCISLVSN